MKKRAMVCGDSSTVDAHHRSLPEETAEIRMWIVVADADSGRVYELRDGAELTIGRAAPADIVWQDPSLSRLHARLRRDGSRVQLCDLDSRNGSWVHGRRIDRAELRSGEVAVLGGVSVSVQLRPSCAPALLGVAGVGSIMQYLETEAARCQLLGRPLSVVVARAVKPRELPLTALAAHCLDLSSPIERVGAYDRELLIAVLPEADAAAAVKRARAIAAASGGGALCGVATLPACDGTSDQLVAAALRALRSASVAQPWRSEPADASACDAGRPVALRDPTMRELERLIDRLAPKRIAVLILGETGTGKELVARELHARSRRTGPLNVVNCAAIPAQLVESVLFGHVRGAFTGAERDQPGSFVQAHRGTVFLDEVGELSPAAQAALLRTLDTHRVAPVGGSHEVSVDVRILAATHRDLAAMAADGAFRLDLYHRLNSVILQVPPLRERLDELEPLIERFIDRLEGDCSSARPRFHPDALARLRAYPWPGNVRELRNVVERALALREGAQIGVADLPVHIVENTASRPGESSSRSAASGPHDLRASVKAYEARLIGEALRQSYGNQRRAAGMLRLPLRTLERKLQTLGADVERPPRD
jgi:DNA-binding NtrC family response regulator